MIPDIVLLKPGKLDNYEWKVMKNHTLKGCDILDDTKHLWADEYYKLSYEICRYHHERYDGSGYPDGLKGDEIPISAQIVAVADAYDALLSERPYKKPFTHDEACKMILDGECGAFSPKIMKCFESVKDELLNAVN